MASPPAYERYQKLALIGSGGMAEVFLGVQLGDEAFHQLVVIKRIRPDFLGQAQAQRMFVDEARTVAKLSHPNIVRIHDLRALDDGLCIAMEYVDGESLSALLRVLAQRGERLPCPIACRLMVQACDALHAAHTAVDSQGLPLGLVHRDVSPNNLMLDRSGFLKVIDFGI
ncbi:MAG: serine/threonine protein kinase, partial [Myxococcales bacterium]|nr:serine/threonine protein kinase [Myxococcales bacterium]